MTIPDIIKKKLEYQKFVEWMGLPIPERNPKEQKQLALDLDVEEATLSDWKKTDGFWDLVKTERKKWAKDKMSNVLAGLYKKAIKDGSAAEVKLFMQYAGEFVEELKVIKEEEYSPELIKKVRDTLENAGFTIAPRDNNGQGEEEDSGKE